MMDDAQLKHIWGKPNLSTASNFKPTSKQGGKLMRTMAGLSATGSKDQPGKIAIKVYELKINFRLKTI